jgi:rubrerythrin
MLNGTRTLGDAIQTAIDYETKILEIYEQAAGEASHPAGKDLYRTLAEDERDHVAYLKKKLGQWQETGMLTAEDLAESRLDGDRIQPDVHRLEKRMTREDRGDEKQMLSKALSVEVETSRFYKDMVGTLSDDARKLFSRFIAIEDAHIEAVQAELDYLNGSGYWFDSKEFDMDG